MITGFQLKRTHAFFPARIGSILVLLVTSLFSEAQVSNARERSIPLSPDTIVLDTLSIIPGSFILYNSSNEVVPAGYYLDESAARFYMEPAPADTVRCTYRVFPVMFSTPYRHKDSTMVTSTQVIPFKPYTLDPGNRYGYADDSGIQKSGSITRGISFGNAQNLSVNSSLNLQLSGHISEKYMLLASITDDNIPIQPDGNSQQLKDFDQVFIQVYDEKSKLIAGDFILRKPQGYFMNYYKRAQGGYFSTRQELSVRDTSAGTIAMEAAASVSKGRFARNTIQGIEGNQGPYRLTGANNELFIVVLAGTEMVYIDGKLLTRGNDRDYVIDYNASEITFTPNQFITKDRRIVVEFQYSDKLYARPLLLANVSVERGPMTYYINAYSENDAKRQPLQQDLTPQQQSILAGVGDDLLSAYYTGIDSVEFSDNAVLYSLRDSLGYDSVFVYSTDPAVAHFRLSFTKLGEGLGDYIEDGFTASGRKFKWVVPEEINGELVHQGDYSPVILLIAPQKKQMVSLGTRLKFPPTAGNRAYRSSELIAEGSLSNNDLNTFSTIDSQDDIGFGFRTTYQWNRLMSSKDSLSSKKKSGFEIKTVYEFTDTHFSPIERFREVEFNRNWNLLTQQYTGDFHLGGTHFGWEKKNLGQFKLGGEVLSIGPGYTGIKGTFSTAISTPSRLNAVIQSSYLETRGMSRSNFFRHTSTIDQIIGKAKIGYRDEHELNKYTVPGSVSLSALSYEFYDWEVHAGTVDSLRTTVTIFYRERIDQKLDSLALSPVARGSHYGIMFGSRGKKGSFFRATVANRKLRILDPELFNQQPENTLLIRGEYNFSYFSGLIQGNTFYETGSGLEQAREFIYLEVPAGQGNYVWNDYNDDGVKDLNEFELAQFAYEANYIRSFIPGTNYVRTYSNEFSQSLNINPAKAMGKKTGFSKFTSRFNDQVSYKADRKTSRDQGADRFNPFIASVDDSSLISLNETLRNIIFFNKSNPVFGLDFTVQSLRNKLLLSNGFESRSDRSQQGGIRWNFTREYTLNVEGKKGVKSASSDFLSGRNFSLEYYSIKPRVTWQPGFNSRFALTGELGSKKNTQGIEKSESAKLGVESTWNSMEKGSFTFTLNYIHLTFNSTSDNSLAFEMLEGLSAGSNFTWSAGLQRTLGKNLQLNLTYNGRKPENIGTIHTGGAQVRAFF